jgi:hypothetical protein
MLGLEVMTRTADDFVAALIRVQRHPEPGYGGNVLPAARIYSSIENHEEIRAYQDAIQQLLGSDDIELRKFAVTLCLGFFTFRDVIQGPQLGPLQLSSK